MIFEETVMFKEKMDMERQLARSMKSDFWHHFLDPLRCRLLCTTNTISARWFRDSTTHCVSNEHSYYYVVMYYYVNNILFFRYLLFHITCTTCCNSVYLSMMIHYSSIRSRYVYYYLYSTCLWRQFNKYNYQENPNPVSTYVTVCVKLVFSTFREAFHVYNYYIWIST